MFSAAQTADQMLDEQWAQLQNRKMMKLKLSPLHSSNLYIT